MSARAVWGRVMDALYAASDASHRARGWEVRKGRFGSRRYRLDVAAWLESQRRLERLGSMPGPVVVVRDEAAKPVGLDALDAGRHHTGAARGDRAGPRDEHRARSVVAWPR